MRRTYVAVVPLTTHEHYVDDIQRLMDCKHAPGAGILTADPVEFVFYTSGTTGKNKLIPTTRWFKVTIPQTIRCSAIGLLHARCLNFF